MRHRGSKARHSSQKETSTATAKNQHMHFPISKIAIRAAQTGVFDLDIRISNRPFIDASKSFAAETGLKSRNVEKRINAV
jgi:hypothetical protein